MNDKPTDKDQGFRRGALGNEGEEDQRNAQPDRIDPSIDIDIIEGDEGDDQSDRRQAGSQRQAGVEKVAPEPQRRK